MTSKELADVLRIAAKAHKANIPLSMLLLMAAERIEELATSLEDEQREADNG
jgi:hypothetical protein